MTALSLTVMDAGLVDPERSPLQPEKIHPSIAVTEESHYLLGHIILVLFQALKTFEE
jgi:hypothetical protein